MFMHNWSLAQTVGYGRSHPYGLLPTSCVDSIAKLRSSLLLDIHSKSSTPGAFQGNSPLQVCMPLAGHGGGRNGTERKGKEGLRSKMRNGTGLKYGTRLIRLPMTLLAALIAKFKFATVTELV